MRRFSLRGARLPEPVFEVVGSIDTADDVIFALGPLPTEVVVGPAGVCTIGERVYVGFGSSISCDRSIRIGAGARLGPLSMIYDSDFHRVGNHDARISEADALPPKTGPVEIGRDVILGEAVTVLRGTVIGDGAFIESGSVVWGSIRPGERVSGRPAQTAR